MANGEFTTRENCSRCNGQGTLSNWDYSFGGMHWDEKPTQVSCPVCGGSGTVEVLHVPPIDHTQERTRKLEDYIKKSGFFDN